MTVNRLFVVLIVLSAGCSSAPRLPTSLSELPSPADLPFVHKVDVQQGNVITQDMLAQLAPQMDKKKVLFIMGTPIVQDTFNANRWDYVYTFTPGGGSPERRLVTLFFEDDKLHHLEGDVVPATGPLVAQLHNDTAVQVPRLKKKSFATRVQEKLPFIEPPPEKVVELAPDGSVVEEQDEDVIPLAPYKDTKKRNPYADLQSAPGEGVIVPADAPTVGDEKKGFLTRFFDSIGLGAEDEIGVDEEEEDYDPGDPKYRDITNQKDI